MSHFTSVDASPDPAVLVASLDRSAGWLAAMKAYVAATVATVARLVRADGVKLPFAGGSFDACRIEQVLQHVTDPGAVLPEVARVVRPDGLLAVFEPNWTSWRADTAVTDAESIAAELHSVRQPDIGAGLPALVAEAGFRIDDVVTESSVIHRLVDVPIGVETGLARAVDEGRVEPDLARRWLTEQQERDVAGTFRLHQSKVLVVAHRSRTPIRPAGRAGRCHAVPVRLSATATSRRGRDDLR